MASFITAGNATDGLQVSSDNTGILQLKTGTGAGTTAVTIDASQIATFSGTVKPPAGTATVAPFNFTAGTNLTTATAGSMEYDGKVIYSTPQSTQRGVVPGAQFFRLNSDLAGANVNTAQSIFGVGVTLSSSTVYAFEAIVVLSKTAGTTSHTIGLGYGGAATVNNILYAASLDGQLGAIPATDAAPQFAVINTTSNTQATSTAGGTTAIQTKAFIIRGSVSVNAGGTFIPQYTCSAAPGGAYSTVAGSYFLIYPISASGANTSVGTWA